MRITFVAMGWEQLGVSLLSAIAKRYGHEVNLAFSVSLFNDRCHLTTPGIASFFDDRSRVMRDIQRQKPDVLAFSPVSGTYQEMLSIANDAKQMLPNVKIVFGGVHATAVPERVLAQPVIDYICIGEGDVAFPLILKAIEDGGANYPIPNTRYKSPDGLIVTGQQVGFVQDLDTLPIFDKTIWEEYIPYRDTYFTMASRGCPYRCPYCFNNFYATLPETKPGKYVRYRSVEHMMYELRVAKKRYDIQLVEFFDDVFTLNKKWLKDFLYLYKKEINVPFQCFTHIKSIDEDVARWLSEAGCRSAQIGIQTMDEDYKRNILNRHETAADIAKAMKAMNKYKVYPKFDHMFGLPGEPLEAQEKARKFYAKVNPYRIQTYWVNFYPGTKMLEQAVEMGAISEEELEALNEGIDLDTFTRCNKYIDVKKAKIYKTYEVLFKLMPGLPGPLRKRITLKFLRYLPFWISSSLTFWIDLAIGFLRWDIDHRSYAKYYLFQIYRFFLYKLGFKKLPPATRPNTSEPFSLEFPQKEVEEAGEEEAVSLK